MDLGLRRRGVILSIDTVSKLALEEVVGIGGILIQLLSPLEPLLNGLLSLLPQNSHCHGGWGDKKLGRKSLQGGQQIGVGGTFKDPMGHF